MSKATSISLTTDFWTSTRQKMFFFGITDHFMNSKLVLKSACICSKRLVGSHTGHRLAELIHDVIDTFEITKKVKYINTDNGVIIVNAVHVLNDNFDLHLNRLPCFGHVLNLIV